MRVLGRIRLSRLTEESTSAARQREIIEQWADTNGHTVIGWAEDLDVSGSIDPFDTPALGPWLTPEKEGEWDILCAWKLDRLGRNSIKLNKLFGWTMENGKTVVSCSEGIDLSTPVGRLIANVIAFLAEGELEAIRERTKASRKALLRAGRWPGGKPPYGLKAVPLEGGGWVLKRDPETAPVVRRIVAEVTAGLPVLAVVEGLNADNIPAPKGGKWTTASGWHIVEAKYLLGHAMYAGNTVRDSQGKPVLNAEPLISQEEWDRLQAAVQQRRITPMRSRNTSPLLGVLLCYDCDKPLHHRVHTKTSGVYRYYYCKDKHTETIPAKQVEDLLEETFLEAVGDKKVLERVFIPAENHEIELEDARRAIEEISALYGTMTSDTMRKQLTEQMRALDLRMSELEKLPSRPAGWKFKETGSTFKNQWENSNIAERRELLLKSGIRFKVKRIADNAIQAEIYEPAEAADLLNAKNPPK